MSVFNLEKNILNLWAGQVFSQVGTRMYQIALSWWILSEIKSQAGLKMGVLLVLGALPAIFAVNWIGRFLDRTNLKVALFRADIAAGILALAVCLYVFLFGPNLGVFYLGSLGLSFFQAILDPGLNRAIPQIAKEKDVEKAVALISSTITLASFLGAIVGAVTVAHLGLQGVLILNALSYFAAAIFTAKTQFKSQNLDQADGPSSELKFSQLSSSMKTLLLGFGFVNFFATPTLVVLPFYVRNVFSGSAEMFALMEGLLWLGMCAGAVMGPKYNTGANLIFSGVLGLMGMGSAFLLNAISIPPWAFGVNLFIAGLCLGFANVKFLSLFQQCVPDKVKGQFFAILGAVCTFTFPVAFFFFGFLVDFVSPRALFCLQGLGILLIPVLFKYASFAGENLLALRESDLWN